MFTNPPQTALITIICTAAASAGLLLGAGCAPPQEPRIRYLALGDSLTGTFLTNTYPQFLVQELDIDADMLAADGVGGRTAAQGLARLDEIVDSNQYPNLDIVIVYLGGADVIDFVSSHDPGLALAPITPDYPFRAEWEELLDQVRSSTSELLQLALDQGWRVYLASYPPIAADKECDALAGNMLDETESDRANEYVNALNDLLAGLALEHGVVLADVRMDDDELSGDPENYFDCIHPSRTGARIIARRLAQTIETAN